MEGHIKINKGKVFRTFIKVYLLFNTQQLSTNIKLTLQKILVSSVVTYTHPAHVFVTDTHLLRLLCLQNKALPPQYWQFLRCTPALVI
jgi:hypothetical protein